MKAWLKGGLISGIIGVIIILISLNGAGLCVDPAPGADLDDPIFGCKSQLERLFINPSIDRFVVPFFTIIIFLSIGAFIGWIVGKVKSRKQGI